MSSIVGLALGCPDCAKSTRRAVFDAAGGLPEVAVSEGVLKMAALIAGGEAEIAADEEATRREQLAQPVDQGAGRTQAIEEDEVIGSVELRQHGREIAGMDRHVIGEIRIDHISAGERDMLGIALDGVDPRFRRRRGEHCAV